jgi:NADH-quinone oxidoreductase subunit N
VFVTLSLGQGWASSFHEHLRAVLWVSALFTLIVGNFIALSQVNLKRMLAYSSIAHTGYLLVGLLSGGHSQLGFAPVVVYLWVYAIMNLGAFTVLTLIADRGDTGLNLQDLSGLSRRHPVLAFSLAVFLFSMAGIPPTGGFVAKYYLFYSAVQAGEVPLVILSVLCSAVSAYYYLRVLVFMYLKEPAQSPARLRTPFLAGFAILFLLILTLQMGVLPETLLEIAKQVTESL